MSASSGFWNPTNTRSFHQQIVKLYAWNRVPSGQADYRCEKREESSRYILSTAEEIHLADHIAFLAQRKSGAKYVSATTIEEHYGMNSEETEMRIRISANETPKLDVVTGLMGVMQRVEMYAAECKSRDDFCEEMFDKVISFSSLRLNERLRSRKHNGHQIPLHLRINSLLEQMKTTLGWRDDEVIASLIGELEDLACCYEKVVDTADPKVQHEILKAAVRKSFLIPFQRKSRSLEEYLKSVGANQMVYQNREVLQIDKIARYLGLCKDFLRICRQPRHRRLFKRIRIEHCVAPPSTQPTGAIKHCHVHGEIQLVLHYEQFPHDPQPRAIGSSKSACFLCDLFIRKHGQYRVSHSHNHLYPQWTIPNVCWMTLGQVSRFQNLVESMINEMARLRESPIQRRTSGVGDSESKTHLPGWQFSTDTASTTSRAPTTVEARCSSPVTHTATSTSIVPASSPSITSGVSKVITEVDVFESDGSHSARAMDVLSAPSLVIECADLPHHQLISLTTPSLHVQVGKLSVIFEFSGVSRGSLFISKVENSTLTHGGATIDVADIPTEDELRLGCEKETSKVGFVLATGDCNPVSIKFSWCEAEGGR